MDLALLQRITSLYAKSVVKKGLLAKIKLSLVIYNINMLRVCHNVFAQRECGWMRDTIATGRRYWGRLQVFTCQPCACLSQCLAQSWVVLWSCTATTSLLLASTVSTSNPNPGLSSLSKSHASHLPLRLKKLTPVKVRMFWVCVLVGI